ncbi:MAG: NAD(P)/FAD-dependent oxidoreductase [Phycisphaerae bacterium]
MLKRHTLVIGGGISGLACAKRLAEMHVSVTVLDKAKGPGGRMASKRGPDEARFDHGPQYFTARRLAFSIALDTWLRRGMVQPYHATIADLGRGGFKLLPAAERYVGVPGMTAVCKHLAENLDYRANHRVTTCRFNKGAWTVTLDTGDELQAQRLVISAPPRQVGELLGPDDPLARDAAAATMHPQWALMLGLAAPLDTPFDAAVIRSPSVSWAARGRTPGAFAETWVIHANYEFSRENLERSAEQVVTPMLESFTRALGRPTLRPAFALAHRWRYSQPQHPLQLPEDSAYLFDPARHLGLCGDWCLEGRVEAAWTSGHHLGERMALTE